MAFDLPVCECTLPDGRAGIDVGVAEGRILAVGPGRPARAVPADHVLDAHGLRVSLTLHLP